MTTYFDGALSFYCISCGVAIAALSYKIFPSIPTSLFIILNASGGSFVLLFFENVSETLSAWRIVCLRDGTRSKGRRGYKKFDGSVSDKERVRLFIMRHSRIH